jgi:Sec-independent protein secretion pathway component TatC
MSTTLDLNGSIEADDFERGAKMSFLAHMDELRRRLVRSAVFVFVALPGCWFVSDRIYNFLAVPIKTALADAQRRRCRPPTTCSTCCCSQPRWSSCM